MIVTDSWYQTFGEHDLTILVGDINIHEFLIPSGKITGSSIPLLCEKKYQRVCMTLYDSWLSNFW